MRVTRIIITFNGDKDKYLPGECVTGQVEVQVRKAVKIIGVTLSMRGWCETKWKKQKGDSSKTYKAAEEYCNDEILLWSDRMIAAGHQIVLDAGYHRKLFSFQLPPECPSSFTSQFGSVFYTLKATCKFLKKDQPFTETKPFFVVNPLDLATHDPVGVLSQMAETPLAMYGQVEQTSCCTRRSCIFNLHANCQAYLPGNRVLIRGTIENNNSSALPYTIALKREVKCSGRRADFSLTSNRNMKHMQHTTLVTKWSGLPIGPNRQEHFANEPTLQIPDLAPSKLMHCNLIEVNYFLEISGVLPGFWKSKQFAFPRYDIIIGTEMSTTNTRPTAPQIAVVSPGTISTTVVQPSSPPASDLPPAFEDLVPSAPPISLFEVSLSDEIQMNHDDDDNDEAPPSYQECVSANVSSNADGGDVFNFKLPNTIEADPPSTANHLQTST